MSQAGGLLVGQLFDGRMQDRPPNVLGIQERFAVASEEHVVERSARDERLEGLTDALAFLQGEVIEVLEDVEPGFVGKT